MSKFFTVITLALLAFPILSRSQETLLITHSQTGRTIEVKVLEIKPGFLIFESSQGKHEVAFNQLTPDTIDRLKAYHAANKGNLGASEESETPVMTLPASIESSVLPAELSKRVNETAGHALFGEKSLWSENASEVAERLKWKLESRKKDTSSYRLYTDTKYQFLGAHPYCVTLYGGSGDRPERLSLVYANKGDFGSRLGLGPDHFKAMHPNRTPPVSLEEAIQIDADIVAEALTTVLGSAEQQYYGEKDDKRKVRRWNLGDHAFLLSSLEGEYTHLLVVPKVDADAQGKVKFIGDSELRKLQVENVVHSDNGDVWIDNIPMVDQGPKGYCAPATFERAMRYMRIPADMYLLATTATETGRGTNTTKLAEDCKRIVRSKARRIREMELNEELSIRTVARYIDKGVPVLWQMRSLKAYNDLANERTSLRKQVTDFERWAEEIKSEAKQKAPQLSASENHHICMIIGYNEKTGELAVSDSWGPNFELRWVHVDIAKAITSRGGFVIDF